MDGNGQSRNRAGAACTASPPGHLSRDRAPGAGRALRLHQPDAGALARQDRAEHGRRRGRGQDRKKIESATVDDDDAHLRPEAGGDPRHAGPIAGFKLREGMTIGCQGHPAAGAHVRIPRPSGDDCAAAGARLPRPQPGRAFDGRGNYCDGNPRAARVPGNFDYDKTDTIRGMDIVMVHDGARPTPRRCVLLKRLQPALPSPARTSRNGWNADGQDQHGGAGQEAPAAGGAGRGQARPAQGRGAQRLARPGRALFGLAEARGHAAQRRARAPAQSLRALGASARLLPQVPHVADRAARTGVAGDDPRRRQGKLVREEADRTDVHERSSGRHAHPHPQRPARRQAACGVAQVEAARQCAARPGRRGLYPQLRRKP